MNQYQISADSFAISSSRAFGIYTDSKQMEYYEGKSSTPRLIFDRTGQNDLHVGIIEITKNELLVWTLQSEEPLSMTQTVFGLESSMKYHLQSESKIIGEKVANAEGRLSFSLNLTNRQKKTYYGD